jgi:hypothetical protein
MPATQTVQPFHDIQKEELDTILILYDVSFKSYKMSDQKENTSTGHIIYND